MDVVSALILTDQEWEDLAHIADAYVFTSNSHGSILSLANERRRRLAERLVEAARS